MQLEVQLEKVVNRLAGQVGDMAAQLAMRDAALEAAHARIAELEQAAAPDGGEAT